MICLYYSDSKEKDLVEGWANYGTKMGFTTITSNIDSCYVSGNDYLRSTTQYYSSTDTCSKNTYYDCGTNCTTNNSSANFNGVFQGTTSTNWPGKSNYASSCQTKHSVWDYAKDYIVSPSELKHRKVKQIIKFKPI
jgi:hypothetical protein